MGRRKESCVAFGQISKQTRAVMMVGSKTPPSAVAVWLMLLAPLEERLALSSAPFRSVGRTEWSEGQGKILCGWVAWAWECDPMSVRAFYKPRWPMKEGNFSLNIAPCCRGLCQ